MEFTFTAFVLIGFLAQLIDGALGMAYGVISSTFLLAFGISPAVASASVHVAEVFTDVVSGASHLFFGNVDKKLFLRLLIPAVLGAIGGAMVVSNLPMDTVKVFVALYLGIMGSMILWKSWRNRVRAHVGMGRTSLLGLTGGFLDAAGGGGWGPIVTSTLVARGNNPRFIIGTVTLVEFFVAIVASITFFFTAGFSYWKIIGGLIVGGVLAAPLAAYLCRRVPARLFMVLVGLLIIVLSGKIIYDYYEKKTFPADCYSFNFSGEGVEAGASWRETTSL